MHFTGARNDNSFQFSQYVMSNFFFRPLSKNGTTQTGSLQKYAFGVQRFEII
jgi:hypothetical protein